MTKISNWLDDNIDTLVPEKDFRNQRKHKEDLLNAAEDKIMEKFMKKRK